ncbi:MAG: molybdopterin molybdotransferase MoeA [Anaerolineales bacterium]
MPEFLTLLPPEQARERLLSHLPTREPDSETIETIRSLDRILAEDIAAPHSLPEFPRSTVDGYAVRAKDTYGASESLPAYLRLIGEAPMGAAPNFEIGAGQCALIHTGGMLPKGADAALMLEYSQPLGDEIEAFKSIAEGENLIRVGEDVAAGQIVLRKGARIRPSEIGGLSALGMTNIRVSKKIKVSLISTGDEVIEPNQKTELGQVRDINSYTLAALVEKIGGEAIRCGIIKDNFEALLQAAEAALKNSDVVVITAGSSASTRDMTAKVIRRLGQPGVLVHGVNTRPGKPTILGVCDGKAVIGLPGNPVSALTNGYLFVAPVIEKLLGVTPKPKASVRARLTVNVASQAGREDWQPVKLISNPQAAAQYDAEPIFGKSNLIFTLAAADGLLRVPPDATGFSAGEIVEALLI